MKEEVLVSEHVSYLMRASSRASPTQRKWTFPSQPDAILVPSNPRFHNET